MKQILIGFSIICFAFSCKKTDKTLVTSKVINEPIDSTLIVLCLAHLVIIGEQI